MAKFKFIRWLVDYIYADNEHFFDWDDGNTTKSINKHGVSTDMTESAFRDPFILALGEQYQPLTCEKRYGVIGQASNGVLLFICFTLREEKIRPISARAANAKERMIYGKEIY